MQYHPTLGHLRATQVLGVNTDKFSWGKTRSCTMSHRERCAQLVSAELGITVQVWSNYKSEEKVAYHQHKLT